LSPGTEIVPATAVAGLTVTASADIPGIF
jgi:hypothetical protein